MNAPPPGPAGLHGVRLPWVPFLRGRQGPPAPEVAPYDPRQAPATRWLRETRANGGFRARNPMEVARMVEAGVREAGNLRRLALALGMSNSGHIHHYLCLVTKLAPEVQQLVESRQLNFHVARSLSYMKHDRPRQVAYARAFASKRLASHRAEDLVRWDRQRQDLSADELIEMISIGRLARRPPDAPPRGDVQPDVQAPVEAAPLAPPAPVPDPALLMAQALELAGRLEELLLRPPPEVERLGLLRALHVLNRRLPHIIESLRPALVAVPLAEVGHDSEGPGPQSAG